MYSIVILKNETNDHDLWIKACEGNDQVSKYRVVDFASPDWLQQIREQETDIILTKPGAYNPAFKQLYDERVYILEKVLGYSVFPTFPEVLIYENKRMLSSWLEGLKLPHPETRVFYSESDAKDYITKADFPIVGKTNIGASGSGVAVLNDREKALAYVRECFSGRGAKQRTGPNLEKSGLIVRGLKYLVKPWLIREKINIYKLRGSGRQHAFAILQQFIPHEYEWRVVRLGDSFFAHKKMIKAGKASGSLIKQYDAPPEKLLDFVKQVTDDHKLFSQAIDIFESDGNYLINEMQCIFGQSDPYQMLVHGSPGRYMRDDSKWVFEPGDFNTNSSYDLRLTVAIENYSAQQR